MQVLVYILIISRQSSSSRRQAILFRKQWQITERVEVHIKQVCTWNHHHKAKVFKGTL